MQYDDSKIEEAVLALLSALESEGGRTWKRYDFAAMNALHDKGYITDPNGRHESVYLTPTGMEVGKRLAAQLFAMPNPSGSISRATGPYAQRTIDKAMEPDRFMAARLAFPSASISAA